MMVDTTLAPQVIMGAKQFAEQARLQFWAYATDTDPAISGGAPYVTARNILLQATELAYPDVDAKLVYSIYVDCFESIEYCVEVVRKDPEYAERNRML